MMIELTIDGKTVRADEGSTILEAALRNGIRIPNLCHDKRLEPHGGCRMCVVEIEGERKLEASCATFARSGMVVRTDTPRVRKIRQTVLEFLMVHHPLDCPVCDKAGECDLQTIAFEYGKPEGRFVRERKNAPPDARGALLELSASRCILCGKCVRLCAEHQGRGALGFIGRGFPTAIQPAFGESLECDFCGQCIDTCPTGAITSKPFKFKARPWSLEEKDTICPFCGCGCTLTLGVKDGRILRARGMKDRGINEGNLCGRGRFGFDYIYSGSRLRAPMIRKKGRLEQVSWEEAFQYASDRLTDIIAAHGPSSVGAIGSPRCTNEENYVLQKFMREAVGSSNIDSSAAFGYGLVEKAWEMAFGRGGHRADLKSPLGKEVILVIESDLSVTHPVFGLNILQANRQGSRLIVADGRKTKLARHAARWSKIKPGTAGAFLNGIMKAMIDGGLCDTRNAAGIEGYPALVEMFREYTPEAVSRITGVAEEELVAVAKELAQARTRMLTFSIGVSENTKGLDTVLAATNLINLLGESPEALQVPAEYANTFGLYRVGVRPDAGAARRPVEVSGKGVREMLYEPGSLNALYVMGADPAANFPHASKIIDGLKALDLLIVQDIALTETAKLAHVVLPASSWAEKDGTFANAEGVSQRASRVVNRTGQSRPDWQIIDRLALLMGKDWGFDLREDIEREINTLTTEPHDSSPATRAFHPIRHSSGEDPDQDYPLNLVLRDVLHHCGSMSTRSESLALVMSQAILEIGREDAERFGISDNGFVKVTSRQGMVYLKAAISDEIPGGTVYVSAHFPHSAVSTLTSPPVNGEVVVNAVRVEKG